MTGSPEWLRINPRGIASHTVQTTGHDCIDRKHIGRKGCQNSSPSALLLFMSQPPQLSHILSLSRGAPDSRDTVRMLRVPTGKCCVHLLWASVLATKSPPSLAEHLLSYFLTTDASPKTFKTTSSPFSLRSHQRDGTKDTAQQK